MNLKLQSVVFFLASLILVGCENRQSEFTEDDLNTVKKEFLNNIFLAEIEEGPFHMHYSLKTVFFSKNLISLFGEINVYDCMPHGWKSYEGKTYVKRGGQFKEIALGDLFTSNSQKEFLRRYCENFLKKDSRTYFGGEDPFKGKLNLGDVRSFVIDNRYLTIILQPYVAVSSADGPFVIKIPFEQLKGQWDTRGIIYPFLQKIISSKEFISSSDDDANTDL